MTAGVVVRGAHLHDPGQNAIDHSILIQGDRIVARSPEMDAFDELVGSSGTSVNLDGLCLLPGFNDSHIHQLEATQDLEAIDLGEPPTVGALVAELADRGKQVAAGEWIVSTRRFHETQLEERRFPTPAELDEATRAHPLMLRRGSHLAVLNSLGVERAGHRAEHDARGRPTGVVRGADTIRQLIGTAESTVEDRAERLERVCALHLSRGLTSVREAGVPASDLEVYEWLEERSRLLVRTDVLIRLPGELGTTDKLAFLEDLGPPPRARSPYLRVDGIKLFVDGRIEDAAMRSGQTETSNGRGMLHMGSEELETVVGRAVELGWRVGAHTVGDRALDELLDAYERVLGRHHDLPKGWLAIEHGLVSDADQRQRAASLGVGVTLQHPLLDSYAVSMIEHWGVDRTTNCSPVRDWIDAGVLVAAGSDGHVTPFDPMRSIWGLVTRQTAHGGVVGADQIISLPEAVWLYTRAGHWLSSESRARQSYADLVGFADCLMLEEPDDLSNLPDPVLAVVGGQPVWDPDQRWSVRE